MYSNLRAILLNFNFLNVKNWPIFFLLLVSFWLFFYQLGSYPLLDPDEPRYVEASKVMMQTGEWKYIFFNEKVRWDKPPLFYWCVASSLKMVGVSEFAGRLPSAIASIMIIAILFWMITSFEDLKVGLYSGLILGTSLLFFIVGHLAITDMVLCLCMTASLWMFFRVAFQNKLNNWPGIYIFMSLGVLTKGPVAVLLPGLIILVNLFCSFKKESWRQFHFIWGGMIVFALSSPWFILQMKTYGMEYFEYFFLKHNVKRFISDELGHQEIWFFIPFIAFVGGLPWSLFIPGAIRSFLKEKKYLNKKIITFFLSWSLIPLAFFTIARAQVPTYILMIFVPFSYLIGKYFDQRLFYHKGSIWFWLVNVILSFITLSILPAYILFREKYNIEIPFIMLIIPFAIFSLGLALWVQKNKNIIYSLSLCMLVVFSLTLKYVFPEIGHHRSMKDLIVSSKTKIDKLDVVASFYLNRPSIVYYSNRSIHEIEDPYKFWNFISEKGKKACFIKEEIYKTLLPKIANLTRVIDNRYGKMLIQVRKKPKKIRNSPQIM